MPRSIVKPSTAERKPSSAYRVKQGPTAVESATTWEADSSISRGIGEVPSGPASPSECRSPRAARRALRSESARALPRWVLR